MAERQGRPDSALVRRWLPRTLQREFQLPHGFGLALGAGASHRRPIRVYCFPHAGGTAHAFDELLPFLSAYALPLPVQLPGRAQRCDEAPLRSVSAVVAALESEIGALLDDGPFAVFGHSMGAKIAFEFSRAAVARGRRPVVLVVSGCPAPHRAESRPKWALASDEALIAHLGALRGTPEVALKDDEFVALLLRYIRADYELSENYAVPEGATLDIPIFAMGGLEDPQAELSELQAWRELTSKRYELAMFPGGHFYFNECAAESARFLLNAIGGVQAARF